MQRRIAGMRENKKFNIMINFDDIRGENRQEHNPDLREIFVHPNIILIIGGSGSVKTNTLLNLVYNQQPVIDNVYLYVKDLKQSVSS